MCNPRKVMVHLTQSIEESWRRSVEQTAEFQENICETGRLQADIQLDKEMGQQALVMLERVLSGEFDSVPAWDQDDDGNYVRNLDNAVVRYLPKSHALQIEAQLINDVSAIASGTQEVCGFTVGEVAAEAVTSYYDDGWGGRTKEKAEKEAAQEAARRLDAAMDALHKEQNPEAFAEAEQKARQSAEKKASIQLEKCIAEAREAMRVRIQHILHDAISTARYEMNIVIGEAYRQTFLALALQNNGRVISDIKTGRVIEMELEF